MRATLEELVDAAALLSSQPLPRGRRVAVLTNAGGLGILCADACEAAGLELPELSRRDARGARGRRCRARRASRTRSTCSARRPAATYEAALPLVLADPRVDALIVLFVPPVVAGAEEVAAAIARAVDAPPPDKPVLAVVDQRRRARPRRCATALARRRVPVSRSRPRARSAARRSAPTGCAGRPARCPTLDGIDTRRRASRSSRRARGLERRLARRPPQARALLEAYGVPLVPERARRDAPTRRSRPRASSASRSSSRRPRRARTRRRAAASRSTCATRTRCARAVERIGAPVLVQPFVARRRRAARRRRPGSGLRPARRVRPGRRARRADRRRAASGSRRSPTSTPRSSCRGGKAGRLVAASAARRRPTRPRSPTSCTGSSRLAEDLPEVAELDLNPVIAGPTAASPSTRASACARGRRPTPEELVTKGADVEDPDVMTTDVLTVDPEASLKNVAALLAEHRVSGLPVVDGDGKVVGVVSEARHPVQGGRRQEGSAGRHRLAARARRPREARGANRGEAMTSRAHDRPWSSGGRGREAHARGGRQPLSRRGQERQLLGIVTRADLVRAFVRSDDAIAKRDPRGRDPEDALDRAGSPEHLGG